MDMSQSLINEMLRLLQKPAQSEGKVPAPVVFGPHGVPVNPVEVLGPDEDTEPGLIAPGLRATMVAFDGRAQKAPQTVVINSGGNAVVVSAASVRQERPEQEDEGKLTFGIDWPKNRSVQAMLDRPKAGKVSPFAPVRTTTAKVAPFRATHAIDGDMVRVRSNDRRDGKGAGTVMVEGLTDRRAGLALTPRQLCQLLARPHAHLKALTAMPPDSPVWLGENGEPDMTERETIMAHCQKVLGK